MVVDVYIHIHTVYIYIYYIHTQQQNSNRRAAVKAEILTADACSSGSTEEHGSIKMLELIVVKIFI